ncbi:fructosamine kinase family protein [Leisingera aquaemixtae]|uniref:Fructosamine kinase family protein n=1 Tax=Leisingera aquaemixtae TaxID=1396826 RepID=A0ABY5WLY9_9RHOB|nr:fructosamine kinase family protein [Leisingera aquaemixtae]UWQ42507.1 fructosamine kinase family protein [Leisingera aquaemixtae]
MSGLNQTVLSLLGAEVAGARPLHGGDLSEVQLLSLNDGRRVVAKTGPLVAAEAAMLRAIRAAGVPAPEVLGVAGHVLLMEALEETAAGPAGWQALGGALRQLHSVTSPQYGWAEDYAFGAVAIPNAPLQDWPAFWAGRRLLAAPDALPRDLRLRIEALCKRLPDLLPAAPPAALLHGDLWTGNVLFSGAGAYLIDPACYHGHGEVDLAMLHLFGTPPAAFHDSYGALEPGYDERRRIYQLWPALVHLRLFGAGYRGMVEARLEALGV